MSLCLTVKKTLDCRLEEKYIQVSDRYCIHVVEIRRLGCQKGMATFAVVKKHNGSNCFWLHHLVTLRLTSKTNAFS